MISLLIEDVRLCMNGLLKEVVFDDFLLHSLDLKVLNDFHISGLIQSAYLTEEEKTERYSSYISWREIRPLVTEIIRNHRTPLSMQISFIISESAQEKLLKNIEPNLCEVIQSFSFRLHFEDKTLRLITATNYKGFLPDKSAEHCFDESIKNFLKRQGYLFFEE